MNIDRAARIRMERAHVAAWPALRAEVIDGWLWRASGGGSQRANSVSTIDFTGPDVERAIDQIAAKYRALDAPSRFQTFDETSPPGLPALLRAKGYQSGEATTTMFKRPVKVEAPIDIESRDHAWEQWRELYLGEITPDRRPVNTAILDRIPHPRRFFVTKRDGVTVSTALCVIAHGCAVVECVATLKQARRQGAGRETMRALENWASDQNIDLLGLQVVSANLPAIGLYAGLDFVGGATNQFWMRDTG